MNHHDFVAGLLAASAAALISTDALAAPPGSCRSGEGRRGYDQGYQIQARLLRANFKRYFTCNSLESFIKAVNIEFPEAMSTDRFLQCRDLGLIDGMNDTIRAIGDECPQRCSDSGGSLGTLAARQYCRIQEVIAEAPSFGAPRYPEPIPICTIATEQACRAAFTSVVENDDACSKRSRRDPNFSQQIEDTCGHLR
jgi:hypothetical protein